jgi:hypothetical protein
MFAQKLPDGQVLTLLDPQSEVVLSGYYSTCLIANLTEFVSVALNIGRIFHVSPCR